jgi:hypothetical protein
MGITISERQASTAGAVLAAGGATATGLGAREFVSVARASDLETLRRGMPALEAFDDAMRTTTAFLEHLQRSMHDGNVPGSGAIRRLPMPAAAREALARADRLHGVVGELVRLDERALLHHTRELGSRSHDLVTAARGDLARLPAMRSHAIRGSLLVAGGAAALLTGGALLAAGLVDVGTPPGSQPVTAAPAR